MSRVGALRGGVAHLIVCASFGLFPAAILVMVSPLDLEAFRASIPA